MQTIVTIEATRDAYSSEEAANNTLTIAEFRDILDKYDDDARIIISNDRGYTFGPINENLITEL